MFAIKRNREATQASLSRHEPSSSNDSAQAAAATSGLAIVSAGLQKRLNERAADCPPIADPRGEFLAMVLHELRNPLNGIQMAISVLRGGDGRVQPDWLLAGLEKATGQVQRLAEDLMDLCQATHPTFRVCARPVDLSRVAFAIIERRRFEFEQRSLWLALRPRPKPVWIMADAERLEMVLGNLLDNAAKYTPPGGQVIVSVAVEDAEAVLRVRDTGIGIAPESLGRVFEPFVREADAPNPASQGSGIGLLLVRTLIQLHGGGVEAFSAGRGLGSEFIVRLPVVQDEPKGAELQRSAPQSNSFK